MSVDTSTLETFSGKSVNIEYNDADGNKQTTEGSIPEKGASVVGIAFKEKGKRDVILIEPQNIIKLDVAAEKPKNLTRKKLKAVTVANVRQHLVDRHGVTLTEANEMTDEQAWEKHNEIDHVGDNLGHKHESEDDEDDEDGDVSEEQSEQQEPAEY